MIGKVLCIGDIILDSYSHGDVKRISPEAPIPVLKVNNNKSNLEKLSKKTYKPHMAYKNYLNLEIIAPKKIHSDEKLSVIKRIEGNNDVFSFGHNNFYIITRYNRSRLYALAVYTLADKIKTQSQ